MTNFILDGFNEEMEKVALSTEFIARVLKKAMLNHKRLSRKKLNQVFRIEDKLWGKIYRKRGTSTKLIDLQDKAENLRQAKDVMLKLKSAGNIKRAQDLFDRQLVPIVKRSKGVH